MGPGTETAWQHDGRILANGEVTFFDDGSNPPIHSQSRGVRIKLDFQTHEARLAAVYAHASPPLLSASQGNMQTLADGSSVVGYGGLPEISEYSEDGALLFDAHEPFDMAFYRAFRYAWSARPADPPAVLASLNDTGEETIVHASWNGATEVTSWRVLAGKQAGSLAVQTTMPASGFESSTTLPKRYSYIAVRGTRLKRASARDLADGQGDQLRRLARERRRVPMRLSSPVSSCTFCAEPSWWLSGCSSSAWSRSSRLFRHTQRPRRSSPGRPGPLAWRSVTFFSRGLAPVVARGLGRSPYQALAALGEPV